MRRRLYHSVMVLLVLCGLSACSRTATSAPAANPPTAAQDVVVLRATLDPAHPSPAAGVVALTSTQATTALPTRDQQQPTPPREPSAAAPTPAAPVAQTMPAAWSIVFQNSVTGSLEAIDSNGGQHGLADPTVSDRLLPWVAAPDGRRIAVVVLSGGAANSLAFQRASLWIVDSDGHNPRKLLDLLEPATTQAAAILDDRAVAIGNRGFQHLLWNAADDSIIITSAHEGQVDLYAVKSDGSAIRRLTNTSAYEYDALLSPDGKALAYASAASFGSSSSGFEQPATWRMQLDDLQPWQINPDGQYISGGILGWLDALRVIVATRTATATNYLVADAHTGQPLDEVLTSTGAVRNGQFFYTDQADPQHSGVYHWDGSAAAPTRLELAAEELNVAPDGQAFVACTGARRVYWWSGHVADLPTGSCNALAWSHDSRLALGNATEKGAIMEPGGSMHDASIQPNAVFAGWQGDRLYYFAPIGSDQWQLYSYDTRTNDLAVRVGQPVHGMVVEPTFVMAH